MQTGVVKLDFSYLYSLSENDKDFEQTLLNGTVANVNLLMNNLQLGWKQKDAAGIRKSAHSLVSLAGIAGLPFIVENCRQLDSGFADNSFHPEFEGTINEVLSVWPQAFSQLKELVDNKTTASKVAAQLMQR